MTGETSFRFNLGCPDDLCCHLSVTVEDEKVMVTVGIAKNRLHVYTVHGCGTCSLKVEVNSRFFVQCGKLIHIGCAGVISVR